MIKVSNLSKSFESFKAIDGLNLHVEHGSIYGLVGPNGAGKTTLMKHLVGILRQDSGTIEIDEHPVYENIDVKDSTIYISDELYFFNNYSIKQMAKLYKNTYKNWNQDRYNKLKEVFNISENKNANRLSKGMQKQVAFWLAMSTMPKVLILDEPLDGLDPVMRRKVLSIIMQDVSERKTTVMISSHNLRELEDVCDYVGILHNGKMLLERKLDEIKSDIHKIQIAFGEGKFPDNIKEKFNLLHISNMGNVYSMILTGNRDKIIEELNKYNPLIIDILPLSLEEIFIYELGGQGYEIKNIII